MRRVLFVAVVTLVNRASTYAYNDANGGYSRRAFLAGLIPSLVRLAAAR